MDWWPWAAIFPDQQGHHQLYMRDFETWHRIAGTKRKREKMHAFHHLEIVRRLLPTEDTIVGIQAASKPNEIKSIQFNSIDQPGIVEDLFFFD